MDKAQDVGDAIYDKTGREIMQGDILKVFHFVGRRRKHHFMYKQVMGERRLGKGEHRYWFVSHLNMKPEGTRDDGYHLHIDGSVLLDTEIVQSIDARFEDRPRRTLALAGRGEGGDGN